MIDPQKAEARTKNPSLVGVDVQLNSVNNNLVEEVKEPVVTEAPKAQISPLAAKEGTHVKYPSSEPPKYSDWTLVGWRGRASTQPRQRDSQGN